MNLGTLVWREFWERPAAIASSFLAIFLGVAALVAMRHVTVFSEREVSRQLAALGANILVLPKSATLQDYYSADANGQTLPEEHASLILMAGLTGIEKLSPKLCLPAQLGEQTITLTGILPQSEFQSKAAWQTATLFNSKKHVGCTKALENEAGADHSPASLASQRTIEELREDEAVAGADLASQLSLLPGSSLTVLGGTFRVIAVLPPTGTVDDGRLFCHLHAAQRLANAGQVVNAIEILGCCEDAAGQLVPQLADLLPDCKVVTISQIVQTQVGVNRLIAKASLLVLMVLVLLGGSSILSALVTNVRERRREIGTLMAIGATPALVSRMFLLKALWLGIVGGVSGSLLGTFLAVVAGPQWAGVPVAPLPQVAALAVAAAVLVAVVSAYWPARQAARLDPCISFREV